MILVEHTACGFLTLEASYVGARGLTMGPAS